MRLVAYCRVSTKKQGESGLGLEAQEMAVQSYAKSHNATVLRRYTEVESGTKSDRPELAKAIAHAKNSRALLVVAKLDRLSRNVGFLSALMDSGLDFVACDLPGANRMTLQIMSVMAENEQRLISERTKAALQAYKARGGLLGGANPGPREGFEKAKKGYRFGSEAIEKGWRFSVEVRREAGKYKEFLPFIEPLLSQGLNSIQIAAAMNAEGFKTHTGGSWNSTQVRLVLARNGLWRDFKCGTGTVKKQEPQA